MSSDPPASTVEFHLYTLSELQNVSTLGWDTLQDSLQQNGTCPSDIFDSLAHYMRLSVNAFEQNVTDLSSLLKSLVDIFTISISLPEFLWRDKDATRKFRHAIVHYHSQIILFYDLFASMYDRLRYLMFLAATPPDADAASNRLYASGTDTSSFVPRRVSFSTGAEHIYHFDHQQPPRILERQRGINGLDNPQSEIHGVFFSKEHCSKIFAPTIVLSLSVSQKREKYRKCSPRKLIAPVTPYDAVKKYGLVPPRNNPYIILLTDVPRSHVDSNFVPLRIPYDI